MKTTMTKILICMIFTFYVTMINAQQKVRIKDVASITGLEDIQVFGYGLVVGLARSGDQSQTVFTGQTIRNMLKNMGIELPDQYIRIRNVAAVMVTGTISPFKRKGTRFDVTVSSIGDASSLEGGTLILTPVQGPDGKIYASAQGPIATGGYDIRNKGLSHIKKNHVLVGRIPDGAIVQKEYPFNVLNTNDLSLSLYIPDFTSAVSMAKSINATYVDQITGTNFVAKALDASTVQLNFNIVARDTIRNYVDIVEFISSIENITFTLDMPAKVVMNERTGTIVAGGNVRISEVAVTHGGVKVEIVNLPEVIQPQPFTLGATEVVPSPEMVVEEKDMEMIVLDQTTTVTDLAQALNSLGVASRDIIAIFQAIKEAGALQGKLIIM